MYGAFAVVSFMSNLIFVFIPTRPVSNSLAAVNRRMERIGFGEQMRKIPLDLFLQVPKINASSKWKFSMEIQRLLELALPCIRKQYEIAVKIGRALVDHRMIKMAPVFCFVSTTTCEFSPEFQETWYPSPHLTHTITSLITFGFVQVSGSTSTPRPSRSLQS